MAKYVYGNTLVAFETAKSSDVIAEFQKIETMSTAEEIRANDAIKFPTSEGNDVRIVENPAQRTGKILGFGGAGEISLLDDWDLLSILSAYNNPTAYIQNYSHFYDEMYSDVNFSAGASIGTLSPLDHSYTDACGVMSLDMTIGGFGTRYHDVIFNNRSGVVVLEWDIYEPQLGDATDDFTHKFGFSNGSLSGALPLNSAYFLYDSQGVGANWRCASADGATTESTDSGVPVVISTRTKLRIEYDTTVPSVKFYINDVLKATHITNVPPVNTDGLNTGVGVNNTGTANVTTIEIDSFMFTHTFPGGR